MFGRWRMNDGVTWVRYVPTQIAQQRRERRERLEKAAGKARAVARAAAGKSVAGFEHGLVQTSAVAASGIHRLTALSRIWIKAGITTGIKAGWRHRLINGLALLGVIAMAGGLLRLALTRGALPGGLAQWPGWSLAGVDRPARLAIAGGLIALGLAFLPWLSTRAWTSFGPHAARLALRALKTRRAGADTDMRFKLGRLTAARAGSIAVTVALTATVLGAAGWSVRWIHTAIMSSATPIAGTARVLGPQLLRVGQAEVQIAGIAAPDLNQTCGEGSRRWKCGEEARRALIRAVAGKIVNCKPQGEDDAGRPLAQCFQGSADIAPGLVKAGHVWADKDDALGYRALEQEAKAAKTGVWRAANVPPWTYRERLWEEAQKGAPDGCPIKGYSEVGQRLYVLPWHPSYPRVRMPKPDVAKAARQWFCSEREARDAGYKTADGVSTP